MSIARPCPIPDRTLLARCQGAGAYVDCYAAEIARCVSQPEYVEAFYTGAVFKLERFLLAQLARKPSTDAQARELAAGAAGTFAAWRVEERSADQLLLCDFRGRTRSWLMSEPAAAGSGMCTRLYFGSAVMPMPDKATGQMKLGFAFDALLGFHKLYSRVLLNAACARLERSSGSIDPTADH